MNVPIYRNVRQHCWSIKAHAGSTDGRVIAHTQGAILADARWFVSEAGRLRVIAEGRKNVHATVRGDLLWLHPETSFFYGFDAESLGAALTPSPNWDCSAAVGVTYNPRRDLSFVRRLDGAPLTRSKTAILAPDGRAYAIRTNACAEALEVAA